MAAAPAVESGRGPGFGRYLTGTLFLLPALVMLGIWMVYPIVYTIVRSFYGRSGFDDFVGIDNYKALFTTPTLTTAIKNNLIWVAVVPAFVTALGLIFAVLTERVEVGGRVQDGRLPADGDLGVRDRRHVADHVRPGPEPRRGQRARALDPRVVPSRPGRSRTPCLRLLP